MTETWDQLVSLALLGTERQPFAAPNLDGTLGAIVSSINANDQEAALLATAAVLSCYRNAGFAPPTANPRRRPCRPFRWRRVFHEAGQ